MFYLTVHDLVWLNSLFAGDHVPFDYERLEACMAAQYGYGYSRDLLGQAAAFAEAMLRKNPFREGNLRSGLVAVSVFLSGNGIELAPRPSVADAVRAVHRNEADGEALLKALIPGAVVASDESKTVAVQPVGPSPSALRTLTDDARALLAGSLSALEAEDGPVPGWQSSPYLHRD